jgi:hypothetical protein
VRPVGADRDCVEVLSQAQPFAPSLSKGRLSLLP